MPSPIAFQLCGARGAPRTALAKAAALASSPHQMPIDHLGRRAGRAPFHQRDGDPAADAALDRAKHLGIGDGTGDPIALQGEFIRIDTARGIDAQHQCDIDRRRVLPLPRVLRVRRCGRQHRKDRQDTQ
jgi:hypothetical protein